MTTRKEPLASEKHVRRKGSSASKSLKPQRKQSPAADVKGLKTPKKVAAKMAHDVSRKVLKCAYGTGKRSDWKAFALVPSKKMGASDVATKRRVLR
jgi:hypothetical protein